MLVGLVLLSTILALLFSGFKWFSSFNDFFRRIAYGFTLGLSYGLGNWAIGTITGRKLKWKTKLKSSNLISLLSFIIYGIAVSIVVPYYFGKNIWNLTGNEFRFHVIINAFTGISIDMIIISIFYTQYLVYYWKKSLEGYEDLKQENLKAKYDALKSQVNPHFLFNSLNTLSGVVEQDQKKAVSYIKKLADIYRYVLEQRDKELVRIKEELAFLDNYIYLAKIRYGNGLTYQYEVLTPEKYIVPLGLQILVENCIKHNVVNDDSPLNIEILQEKDYMVVKNNLQKKTTFKDSNTFGLENLKNRYTYISELPVQILNEENYYIVKIPVIESSGL